MIKYNSQKENENILYGKIINAMMYITGTGCQWRMLPKDFASWQTVYFY